MLSEIQKKHERRESDLTLRELADELARTNEKLDSLTESTAELVSLWKSSVWMLRIMKAIGIISATLLSAWAVLQLVFHISSEPK